MTEDNPFTIDGDDDPVFDRNESLVLDVIRKMGEMGGTVDELVWALAPLEPKVIEQAVESMMDLELIQYQGTRANMSVLVHYSYLKNEAKNGH